MKLLSALGLMLLPFSVMAHDVGTGGGLIAILVWFTAIIIVMGFLYYVLKVVDLPPPVKTGLILVLGLIGVIIVLSLLFSLTGTSFPRW